MAKQSKAAVNKPASKKTAIKKAAPKKAAAKPAAPTAAKSKADSGKGKLHGKTVAFVGKFYYKGYEQSSYVPLILSHGGQIVDSKAPKVDYLFAGDGVGGKPPSDVAKIQKRIPSVQVLTKPDIDQLLLPTREELLVELAKGVRKEEDHFWPALLSLLNSLSTSIDLSSARLQGQDLSGAKLKPIELTGSDLRRIQATKTYFGDLTEVDLRESTLQDSYLGDLTKCNFSEANLQSCQLFHDCTYSGSVRYPKKIIKDCNFTATKLHKVKAEGGTFTDCDFTGADLTASNVESSTFTRADFTKANLTQLNALQAKFESAYFTGANLYRADFALASLVNADLRNANLREAFLCGTDLTGAKLDGADLQDVVWANTKFDPAALKKAKNVRLPEVRQPGPKLLELVHATAGAQLETTCRIDFGEHESAQLTLILVSDTHVTVRASFVRKGQRLYYGQFLPTLDRAMLEVAARWPNPLLRLDSITAKDCKKLRGQKLLDLVIAAWAEAFGKEIPSPEVLAKEQANQKAAAQQARDELVKMICKQGSSIWNELNQRPSGLAISFRGADFSRGKLDGIEFHHNQDLQEANFTNASMRDAKCYSSRFQNANFTNADLSNTLFNYALLTGAKFQNATLDGTCFNYAKVQGADFTGASLKDTYFTKTQYDETTIWPAGYAPSNKMVWKGKGPRGGATILPPSKPGTLDFDTFLKDLGNKVEAARMDKAGSMLKAERFQLFAEVKDTGIVGIVKSQSSGELVYSCRLNSDGAFGCCTQNLRPCGGLRGAICKHLLVLIVGLAKAGQLDPATVNLWVDLSTNHKPAIEEDAMSATFLRYKGAESGEIDWRPTETIPEDFYAM